MYWLVVLLLVSTVHSNSHNPDENQGIFDPNLFEGDMILSPKERYNAEHGRDVFSSDRKRGARRFRLWPRGEIVYEIQPQLAGNSRAMSAIRAGMAEWTTKTCIRFKKRTNETSYVLFQTGRGCSSQVGRTGRQQQITLAPGCWFKGIVAHEIGHALGFFHEQSRPDRDMYVKILFENVISGRERNFNKYSTGVINSLGSPYDYGSVMHYKNNAFSKNGRPTIEVLQPGQTIGQRGGLSPIDASQANKLYKSLCAAPIPTATPVPTATPPACRDSSQFCRHISLQYCSFHLMRSQCKRTCNTC